MRKLRLLALPATAFVLSMLLSRPVGASATTVVVVGSAVKVRPTDIVTGPTAASITAARNEFESFQVVVQAGSTPVTNLVVSLVQPLTGSGGTIPADNVTIYREGY